MSAPKGMKPWNAGTSKGWIDKRGYRWLYITENGRRRARRQHRILMEQHLGRRLQAWEIVHHKNGDTKDNRLDNLEVIEWGAHTIAHHSHARHSWESKRSMEVFARLREELKHLRAVNADLLEATKLALDHFGCDHNCRPQDHADSENLIRAAIAKAEAAGRRR